MSLNAPTRSETLLNGRTRRAATGPCGARGRECVEAEK